MKSELPPLKYEIIEMTIHLYILGDDGHAVADARSDLLDDIIVHEVAWPLVGISAVHSHGDDAGG